MSASLFSRRGVLAGVAALGTATGLHRGAQARVGGARFALNQVGWRAAWPKRALLVEADEVDRIQVADAASGMVVAEAPAGRPRRDDATGMRFQAFDLSGLDQAGRYHLRSGRVQSAEFAIRPAPYDRLLQQTLRSFYLQRCGVPVNDSVTGVRHGPCHQGDAATLDGRQIAASGGWHDAGDYGKYVATTSVSAARLLSLYEAHPGRFTDRQLQIPESGNGQPDILDEAMVGLDWLVRMQRGDGAFYRKLSGRQWPSETTRPEADTQARFAFGVSTSDTARAAGALAIGARVLRGNRPETARRYLAAATSAWRYLDRVRSLTVDERPGDDEGSGRYLFSEIDDEESLRHDRDDRLFAAAELFITTGEGVYRSAFESLAGERQFSLFGWKDPSGLGLSDWVFTGRGPETRPMHGLVRDRIVSEARRRLEIAARNGWGLAIDRFVWGSNKVVAEAGIAFLHAWRLTRDPVFFEAAVDQLDWLLGRNPLGKSFVTGFGADQPRGIHHRVMQSSGVLIPGLLAGGPNDRATDPVAPRGQGMLSYVDDTRSYATNETAIDYNASLAALVGLLAAEARA